MNKNSILINGQWLVGEGIEFRSLNPIDNQAVWEKQGASAEQVKQAVDAARAAQTQWALTPLANRIEILQRFAELLKENQAELAGLISAETGKPDWEALTEVSAMANKVAISIAAQEKRASVQNGYQGSNENLSLTHRPHGVMAVYGPYNFPGHLPNGHIVPALLAGNTIVFKPSEETPAVAEKTVELWQQAGLPDGVINLVQGAKEVGIALGQQDIDGLLFTGSSTTGKILHKQFAGKPEVLLALEMGGNNPVIVDKNIQTENAINVILQSAFLSAGQRCTCARRLIVVENENSEQLINGLVEKAARLIADKPDAQPEPFMGPVINAHTKQALLDAQDNLTKLGGEALLKMQSVDETSNLLSPGIIDMTDAANVPDEEWFGPLLQVYRVATFEDAIMLANNTRYGLAAGLISDDQVHQNQFVNTIRAGVVSINQPTAGASSELPFGGVGLSGNHRASAYYAADYCAWPQALTTGAATEALPQELSRGLRK
ncbi:succinylglutamate-semialdehyde dehydrogenase [Bermanella sp. R86510]|uniref:succinylglutamate-semialdehyde dehydrogenase n=1 Tax=unclassified Bermanella TaxID=2627862 RepID=UPI0037C692F2